MTRIWNKQQTLDRNEDNAPAFDEMTLEECVTMNEWGVDFECADGKIIRVIENY